MKRIAATLLATVLVVVPLSVRPLGLGEIELRSHLNEPLDATIPLHAVGDVDLDTLRVSLATEEQFRRAGIERPFLLSSLDFELEGTGEDARIEVTTRERIAEPFLNFLLAVDWANGRVLREYTLLIDPPVYGAAIRTRTAESVPIVEAPPAAAVAREQAPAAVRSVGGGAPRTYGPVQRNETLWSLAERFRGDAPVSIQQMMLAMLRLNPEAFRRGNINLLRAGAVLEIPTAAEAAELSRGQALAEVRRQHAAWQDFRERGAGQVARAPTGTTGGERAAPRAGEPSEASGTQASAAESPAPSPGAAGTGTPAGAPGAETASERSSDGKLTLESGGTAAGGVGSATDTSPAVSALRAELESAREEADVSRREAEELAARVEEAEALVQELERLVRLRDRDLAALQEQLQRAEASLAESRGEMPGVAGAPGAGPAGSEGPGPSVAEGPAGSAGEGTGVMREAAPQGDAEPPAPAAGTTPAQPPPEEARRPVPLPPVPAVEPGQPTSIMDLVRSALEDVVPFDPILLLGGLILLVVIVVVVIVFSRRRRAEAEESEALEEPPVLAAAGVPAGVAMGAAGAAAAADDDDEVTQRIAPQPRGFDPAVASAVPPAESIAGAGDDSASELGTQARELVEDPLAEANVYLAYERYEQAESLVKDAIEAHPDRPEYRLKLLEVYHASKNVAAFGAAAMLLRDAVGEDHEMLRTAREWWSELAPGTDLFGDGGGPAGPEPAGSEPGAEVTDMTTRLAAARPPAGAADTTAAFAGAAGARGVDFDLGLDFGEDEEAARTGVDFDLGLGDAEAGATTGLDLDLSEFEGEEGEAARSVLDFDLEDLETIDDASAGSEDDTRGLVLPVEEGDFEATTVDDTGDLPLDDLSEEPTTDIRDEGLELDFDDPLEATTQFLAPQRAAEPAGEEEGSDTDLDFDLGALEEAGDDAGLPAEPRAGAEDAGDELPEADLDFDLETLADTSEIPDLEREVGGGAEVDFDISVPGEEAEGGGELDFDFDAFGLAEDEDASSEGGTAGRRDHADALEMPSVGGEETLGLEEPEDEGADTALHQTSELEPELGAQRQALDLPGTAEAPPAIDDEIADLFEPEEEREAEGSGNDLTAEVVSDDEVRGPGGELEALDFELEPDEADVERPGAADGEENMGEGTRVNLDAFLEADEGESAREDDIPELDLEALDDEEDLDLDFGALGDADASEGRSERPGEAEADLDFDGLDLTDETALIEPVDDEREIIGDETEDVTPGFGEERTVTFQRGGGESDGVQTKLDLAQAYLDMGDGEGAKGILAEVLSEGDEKQRAEAESLLRSID